MRLRERFDRRMSALKRGVRREGLASIGTPIFHGGDDAIAETPRAPAGANAIAAGAKDGDGMYKVRNNLFPRGLHLQYPEMALFLRHGVFIDLATHIVGGNVEQTWNLAIIKPAKAGGRFSWHQDGRYAISDPLDAGFTLWVAINKTTIANGTLWVAPSYWSRGLLPHVWDVPLSLIAADTIVFVVSVRFIRGFS